MVWTTGGYGARQYARRPPKLGVMAVWAGGPECLVVVPQRGAGPRRVTRVLNREAPNDPMEEAASVTKELCQPILKRRCREITRKRGANSTQHFALDLEAAA